MLNNSKIYTDGLLHKLMNGSELTDFGNNWSGTHNGTTIRKINRNTFSFRGEHTGSFRKILLSGDTFVGVGENTDWSESRYTIPVIPRTVYRLTIKRTDDNSGNAPYTVFHVVGNNGSTLASRSLSTIDNKGGEDELIFLVPANVDKILIEALIKTYTYNSTFEFSMTYDFFNHMEYCFANLYSLFGNKESEKVATKAYSKNEMIVIDRCLYITKQSIESGEELVVGTNIEQTSIGSQLTALLKNQEVTP